MSAELTEHATGSGAAVGAAAGDAAPSPAAGPAPTGGIRFDQVTVAYGSTVVLDSLDLSVAPGEVVALLGPSGSGKTTALRAVAGFVRPRSGRVHLGGRDVTDLPPHRRGIGMVVQSYALFPHMRVEQNVAFGLRARRVRRAEAAERVNRALAMTGMADYARRYPRELSGGQQQRVALARALAIRPDVLLLDEPLSALDAQLRSDMLAELDRLHRELPGVSILYVTHDQIEALTLADRIAVMREARLVECGTPRELYRAPRTEFTASFVGAANLLPVRVDGSGGIDFAGTALRTGEPAAAAGAATLCVRPHAVRLAAGAGEGAEADAHTGAGGGAGARAPAGEGAPAADAEPNLLTATVTGVQWRGSTHRIITEAAGHEVRADVGELREPPRQGDRVRLAFAAEDAVLLPAGGGHG